MQYYLTVWNGTEWQEVASVEACEGVDALGKIALLQAVQEHGFVMRAYAHAMAWMFIPKAVVPVAVGTYCMTGDQDAETVSIESLKKFYPWYNRSTRKTAPKLPVIKRAWKGRPA